MRHVKAFTYQPKIEAVRSGRCTQTIRALGKRPVGKGDTILFHGWLDKPYRSPWNWRLEVEIIEAIDIEAHPWGIILGDVEARWKGLDELAQRDYIEPPTGEALGELLNSMYDLYGGKNFQIIRWVC